MMKLRFCSIGVRKLPLPLLEGGVSGGVREGCVRVPMYPPFGNACPHDGTMAFGDGADRMQREIGYGLPVAHQPAPAIHRASHRYGDVLTSSLNAHRGTGNAAASARMRSSSPSALSALSVPLPSVRTAIQMPP